jgi:hypothetical protein
MYSLNDISNLSVWGIYPTCKLRITDVWVGGKRVIENKKNMVLNENEIREKARSWGSKIKNYLAQPSNF